MYRRNRRGGRRYRNGNQVNLKLRSPLYPVLQQTTPAALTIRFQLDMTLEYNQWVNLYDQYRINKVVVKWCPHYRLGQIARLENTTVPGTQFDSYPRGPVMIGTVIDHDDDNPLASFNNAQLYNSFKMFKSTQTWSRVIIPSVLFQTYESTIQTGYAPRYKQWISSNDASVPHYGFKAFGMQPEGDETYYLKGHLELIFYVSFKNKK